ncbi:hypothetical protein IWX84_002953 [Flavobacterium sp. CG_9.10]|uniref:hypothetical protein n=1 Tax=Flavobacterium sp. CG_9.10 TaxID=2787729 RepID=UPI0018C93B4A|nr:hypothetical protein [Flavobacterium sp. CG_9.10]MBG6112058.1 hypothetical protein [Flavobacterium sp. CG_9.10]
MYYLFVYIGELILLLNLILFVKGFPNQGRAYRIFTGYLGIILIIEVLSGILKRLHIHNLFLSHFYFIGQFVILSFFYLAILKDTHQKKIIQISFVIGLLALMIQYGYDSSLFFAFNLFEIVITSFLLIVFATFHFYNMLNGKKEFYYINTGILMYLFGSTILFLVGNLTAKLSPTMSYNTWTLNAFLYIVYQFFVFVEWKKSFSNKTGQ